MQGWFHTEIPDKVSDAIYNSSQKKQFTNGAETSELEDLFKKRLSVKYSIYTNSGTSALAMALLAIGVKEGDEVIVPAIGWIATAQAVLLTGAKPVIVDTVNNHTNIDIKKAPNRGIYGIFFSIQYITITETIVAIIKGGIAAPIFLPDL